LKTSAYMNWGRWVVPCPRPGCTSAMQVELGQRAFQCGGMDSCGMVAEIVWPVDADAITRALQVRPLPRTRNWVPGETLADLVAENREHVSI